MFKRIFGSSVGETKSEFEIVDDDDETTDQKFLNDLKLNMTKLIAYAQSADVNLQREVAERLANEAVKADRQQQIVECNGLRLLVPLTQSSDKEVRRLAAHALANLSVNQENQVYMAKEGAIEMLISLLDTDHDLAQRQSAKALANLGVNVDNKRRIVTAGAVPRLVLLASSQQISVRIEAVAALANLAVNDLNEADIVAAGGLSPIVDGARLAMLELMDPSVPGSKLDRPPDNYEELAAQCARALRNLSGNEDNRPTIINLGGATELKKMMSYPNERIMSQARRAMRNINPSSSKNNKK